MVVTLAGMVNVLPIFSDGYWMRVFLLLSYNTPLSAVYALLPASTDIAVKWHLAKALDPMLVTLAGMVMLARLEH